MKIPGLTRSHPRTSQAMRDVSAVMVKSSCTANVAVHEVFIEHHGIETNYRPYLRISGTMSTLMPTEPIESITEIEFASGSGPAIDAMYEFTDEQLSALVAKGYFTGRMAVPSQMIGAEHVMPIEADLLVLHPLYEDDVPAVWVIDLVDQHELVLDLANSGYDYDYLFENVLESPQVEQVEEFDVEPEVDGLDVLAEVSVDDLTIDRLRETGLEAEQVAADQPDVDLSSLDELVPAEAEAQKVEQDDYADLASRIEARRKVVEGLDEPQEDVIDVQDPIVGEDDAEAEAATLDASEDEVVESYTSATPTSADETFDEDLDDEPDALSDVDPEADIDEMAAPLRTPVGVSGADHERERKEKIAEYTQTRTRIEPEIDQPGLG